MNLDITNEFGYDTSMALCKTAVSPLVNALEVLQSCLLLHEILTYKNMALSLINSSTAERFPNTMFMTMKKNTPTLQEGLKGSTH